MMIRRSIPLLLAVTSLLLAACSDSTGPLPAWPEDGQTPAVGRYEYVVSWPALAGTPAGTHRGTLLIRQASPANIEGEWQVSKYQTEAYNTWDTTSYRQYVWNTDPVMVFEHRMWRPDGAERLECAVLFNVPGSEQPQEAECSLRLVGGL